MRDLLIFLSGTLTGLVVAWIAIKFLRVPVGRKEIAYLRWARRNSPAWPPAIPPPGGWPTGTAAYADFGCYRPANDNKAAN